MGNIRHFTKIDNVADKEEVAHTIYIALQDFCKKVYDRLKSTENDDVMKCANNFARAYFTDFTECTNGRLLMTGDEGATFEIAVHSETQQELNCICRRTFAGGNIFEEEVEYTLCNTLREVLLEIAKLYFEDDELLEEVWDDLCEISMEVACDYCDTVNFEE